MARVAAISDLHGRLPRTQSGAPDIPPCDVLVIAGDIAPDFMNGLRGHYAKGEAQQSNWLDGPFREWLEEVIELRNCKVIGIAGNHDFVFESKVEPRDLPWTYLWDQETTVEGLRFYGVPWCPRLGRWAFYADDRRLRLAYESVPDNVDVLISHSPPRGYGDKIPTSSMFNPGFQDIHVGTPQLTNILHEKKPKTVVSGHIHEARGRYEYHGGAVVYNVAYLTEEYEPYGSPFKAATILKEFD